MICCLFLLFFIVAAAIVCLFSDFPEIILYSPCSFFYAATEVSAKLA